jgi:hypothetical protein
MGDMAKPLLPFLQRADEMAKADPKVAYYCRMHAMEAGRGLCDGRVETYEGKRWSMKACSPRLFRAPERKFTWEP